MTSNADIARSMADNMTHSAVPLYGKRLRLPDRGAVRVRSLLGRAARRGLCGTQKKAPAKRQGLGMARMIRLQNGHVGGLDPFVA